MKLRAIVFYFLFLFSSRIFCYAHDPLLVMVIMIKDEAHCIEKTLQPWVDGGVREFLIFDTGSTDGTQEIVRNFFKRHNITRGYLEQEPFVDFATSRNRVLEFAEQHFPNAAFFFMLDANWYIHNVPGLLKFCRDHLDDALPSYLVRVVMRERGQVGVYKSSRLFKRSSHIRYRYPVHEVINKVTNEPMPDDIYCEQVPGDKGIEKTSSRFLRDRRLLLKEFEKNPQDPRVAFYLAQTYSCLLDWENAYKFYKIRTQLRGYDEETYLAWYRLGLTTDYLANVKKTKNWAEALEYYAMAHAIRPHRVESLARIADYYHKTNNRAMAFVFAKRAAELPFPQDDNEIIDFDVYTFHRFELLSICAFAVGEYELGEWATRQAIKARPDEAHLHQNLAMYLQQKKNKQGTGSPVDEGRARVETL